MTYGTKKTDNVSTFRPLYAPESLLVQEDARGFPVRLGKALRKVTEIDDRWRIDDEWWRTEQISRMYFSVILDTGQRLIVYKDLITGRWYRQKIGSRVSGD